jgi:hypothetical protein
MSPNFIPPFLRKNSETAGRCEKPAQTECIESIKADFLEKIDRELDVVIDKLKKCAGD